MTFVTRESNVKEIRQGEDGFMLDDGILRYPRAMIHISPLTPSHMRNMIQQAVLDGYLKSVAHIYKHEETFNIMAGKG